MSLEEYLRPVKAMDKAVQKQYTRLGQKIPEKQLYRTTYAVALDGAFGLFAAFTKDMIDAGMEPAATSLCSIAVPWILGGTDHYLNCMGLAGKLQKQQEETACIDAKIAKCEYSNRRLRLPYLLMGVGGMAKAAYEVAKYVTTAEPMDAETMQFGMGGYGLFALASSMYLKDQDPKLLKKAPKWKVAYRFLRMKQSARKPVLDPVVDAT